MRSVKGGCKRGIVQFHSGLSSLASAEFTIENRGEGDWPEERSDRNE